MTDFSRWPSRFSAMFTITVTSQRHVPKLTVVQVVLDVNTSQVLFCARSISSWSPASCVEFVHSIPSHEHIRTHLRRTPFPNLTKKRCKPITHSASTTMQFGYLVFPRCSSSYSRGGSYRIVPAARECPERASWLRGLVAASALPYIGLGWNAVRWRMSQTEEDRHLCATCHPPSFRVQ